MVETTNDGNGASQNREMGFGGSTPLTRIAPEVCCDFESQPEEKKPSSLSFTEFESFVELDDFFSNSSLHKKIFGKVRADSHLTFFFVCVA